MWMLHDDDGVTLVHVPILAFSSVFRQLVHRSVGDQSLTSMYSLFGKG